MLSSVDSGKYFSQLTRFSIDFVLVVLFIAIGLLSHRESLINLPATAAPFILAMLAAHLGVWVVKSRRQLPLMLEGFMLWVTTLVLGIGIRLSFGDTAATPFVIVSAVTLLVFLLGWRCLLLVIRRQK